MKTLLSDVAGYLDTYLNVRGVPDDPRALNGLQVDREGEGHRVAVAVDVCRATIEGAAARGADLLIVHHGLFWGGLRPLTGFDGRRVRALVQNGLALYSAHLPLDCHAEVGNNAVIAAALGLVELVPFGRFEGVAIGLQGRCDLTRDQLLGADRGHPGEPRQARAGGSDAGTADRRGERRRKLGAPGSCRRRGRHAPDR